MLHRYVAAELARSYARVVVEEEWPLMQQGDASPKAWDLLDELRGSIEAFHPTTDAQVVLYDHELQGVHGSRGRKEGAVAQG
jgi:hypothetical protein